MSPHKSKQVGHSRQTKDLEALKHEAHERECEAAAMAILRERKRRIRSAPLEKRRPPD